MTLSRVDTTDQTTQTQAFGLSDLGTCLHISFMGSRQSVLMASMVLVTKKYCLVWIMLARQDIL